ncbi:MAG TPA: hypothetical protein VGS19_18910 [Streptosporangiaceae bacterium]|nr:hypothetical protein [Streptosporangiaceae bacterium]
MRPQTDNTIPLKSRRLADLRNRTAELERRLTDMRMSIERELSQAVQSGPAAPGPARQARGVAVADLDPADDEPIVGGRHWAVPGGDLDVDGDGEEHPGNAHTEVILTRGRSNAYRPGLSLATKATGGAAIVAALALVWVMVLSGGGASWPASVAVVQGQANRACQNPDVASEPGQVNFACARSTRQILWVFALMTSGDNPDFADAKTGRVGLEPISPAQGGELAWSLNLHHPYDPTNPVDSLAVAARAINNIIGGATVIGANGSQVVQPGLEGDPANCRRYTGSARLKSQKGFPSLCAKAVTGMAGEAALVADVYQRWVVGATTRDAQDTAALFENANNPGDQTVQAILKHLPHPTS